GKVFQQFWDNQAFTAGQTRTYTATWQVPSGAVFGSYAMDVGVFSPGWGTLQNWNGSAGGLQVTSGSPATSTPTVKPTNTPTVNPDNPQTVQPTNPPTAKHTNTPTPTPTNTPPLKPPNTPTTKPTNPPTPAALTFNTSGSASPASVARGANTSLSASVRSSA